MARKIKFPLEMKDGVKVRTIEELRENFSMERVICYYSNGKLITWLKDRYYEEEADKISKLDKNSSNFKRSLCDIIGAQFVEDELDIEDIQTKSRRISYLKQFTDDEEIIKQIDKVAFNQEELDTLIEQNHKVIFLCGKQFVILLDKENIKYIGINHPIIIIKSNQIIDFEAKKIFMENVKYDDEYSKLLNNKKETDSKSENFVLIEPYELMRSPYGIYSPLMTGDKILIEKNDKKYVYEYFDKKIYVIDSNNIKKPIDEINAYNLQKIIAYKNYIIYKHMIVNDLDIYLVEDNLLYKIDSYVVDFTVCNNEIYYYKSLNKEIRKYNLCNKDSCVIKDFGKTNYSVWDLKCDGKRLIYRWKGPEITDVPVSEFIDLY